MLMRTEAETERREDTDLDESLEPRWQVFVHNDDVTPYDFVIMVLMRFFQLNPPEAEHITWTAHNTGSALVAILPKPVAQRRIGRAHFAASLEGFPLKFSLEPE